MKLKKKLVEGEVYSGPEAIGTFRVLKRFVNREKEPKVVILKYQTAEELERYEDLLAGVSKRVSDLTQFKDSTSNEKYVFTIGYLARNGTLVADIPFTSQEKFDNEYEDCKGHAPNRESSKYLVHKCGDTFTYALRLYVPMCSNVQEQDLMLPESVINNMANHDSNTKRISNNKWLWDLINMGFDLGSEHDVTSITSYVPAKLIPAFNSGYTIKA